MANEPEHPPRPTEYPAQTTPQMGMVLVTQARQNNSPSAVRQTEGLLRREIVKEDNQHNNSMIAQPTKGM